MKLRELILLTCLKTVTVMPDQALVNTNASDADLVWCISSLGAICLQCNMITMK